MARTVSVAMAGAIGAAHTQPGYCVLIEFSTPVRLSSRGMTAWNGHDWLGVGMSRPEYWADANGVQYGSIRMTSLESSLLALALGEGVADRTISVWCYDAAALAAPDPVLDFYGVGDSVDGDAASLTLTMHTHRAGVLYAPRLLCIPGNGFNHLPKRGQVITWGEEIFEFE